MGISNFKLNERTILLKGELSSTYQAIATALVEAGADVGLVCKDTKTAERWCHNLNDLREVNPDFGHSAAIKDNVTSTDTAREAITRVAELFGSIDIYIDASFNNFDQAEIMSEELMPFLKKKNNGRIIFLTHQQLPHKENIKNQDFALEESYTPLTRKLSSQIENKTTCVNCLLIGLTEELALKIFPNQSIQDSINQLKKEIPTTQLLNAFDVAQTVKFFSSPLSKSISGQTIHVNRGLSFN